MEAPSTIEGEATKEEAHIKDTLPSTTKITNHSDSETSNHKSVQTQHFENISNSNINDTIRTERGYLVYICKWSLPTSRTRTKTVLRQIQLGETNKYIYIYIYSYIYIYKYINI